MKIVAALFADYQLAPSGHASRLDAMLADRPVIDHALRRLARIEGVDARCLFVSPADEAAARGAVDRVGLVSDVEVVPADTVPRRRRPLTVAARKWSLDAWRGGLLGSTWIDEFADPNAVVPLINHYKCHAVLCLSAHQAVFDPDLASQMVAHARRHEHSVKFVFTQLPPGLSGAVVRRELLEDVLRLGIPIGLILTYRPEFPQADPITHDACFQTPADQNQTIARFVPDTQWSRDALDAAICELGEDARAAELCAWIRQPGRARATRLPLEVELELTTEDPLPDTTLRPRGGRTSPRVLDDLDAVSRLAEQLGELDDRLVLIGGHGDPLAHPQFGEVCRRLRSAGVYGIGVATPLVDLPDCHFEALFGNEVDVVEVQLDAATRETYTRVHNRDAFDQVIANIERLDAYRRNHGAPRPIVTSSFTRCAATIGEMEAFYDDRIRETGTAILRGYNDYCGRMPSDTLLSTTPAERDACERLSSRLMLLADGRVAQCAQDLESEYQLGDWRTQPLRDIWEGAPLQQLRTAHDRLELGAFPLCEACQEWRRP